jgi:hypothetical protein
MMMAAALTLAACGKPADQAPPAAGSAQAAPVAVVPPTVDSAAPAPSWDLSETGIGPVRVGMTVAEASAVVPGGAPHPETQECAYVGLSGLPEGVSLMTEGGRIVRVDVDDSSQVATARGARVGSTEASVLALYPGARVQPHKYEDGHYVVAIPGAPADTVHRLVFETVGGVVKRFRGGVIPAVEYVEGCS